MPLKEEILAAATKCKGKTQAIKAWGVDAFIRVMTGTERDAWEAEIFRTPGKKDMEKFRARLLVNVLADAAGNCLFGADDVNALSDMDSVELQRLYELASKLNGLTKEDVDDLTKK